MRAPVVLAVLAVVAVPSRAFPQTGTWTVTFRPSSGGTADYADEAGHAATADTASEADHAATADSATTSTTATSAATATHATTADSAATAASATTATAALTANAFAADPPPCPPGQYVADLSASGILTCSTPPAGTGDVVGPAATNDNVVPRYDGITGKLLQSSQVTISDAGGINTGTVSGTGNIALRAWSGYNDGSKPLSIGNSGVGEVLFLDSIGTMYLKSQFSAQDTSGVHKVALYPFGNPYVAVASAGTLRWSSTTSATGSPDTSLARDAPGVVKISDLIELTPIATAPACDATAAGRIYHDTAPALCWCSGTAWVVVAGAGPCA